MSMKRNAAILKNFMAGLGLLLAASVAGQAQNTPTLALASTKVGISSNEAGYATNFNYYMEASGWPRQVTAGEAIFMMGSWPAGNNPTMTDDKSNTLTSEVSCNDSQGLSHGIFYEANAAGGTSILTQTHSSAVHNTVFDWAHFYNMATTSTGFVDGSSCQTGVTPTSNTAPNISGTAYTMASSGDLILTCIYVEQGSLGAPNPISSIAWPAGFTGLGAETTYGHFCAYGIGSAGSFTPTFTVAQSTHNTFSIVSAAFKPGSGGSAPSAGASVLLSEMHYVAALGQTDTLNLPCPTGTTAVALLDDVNGINSIADNNSNNWLNAPQPTTDWGGIWYMNGPTISSTNGYTVTMHIKNTGNYDLFGLFCLGGTGGIDTGATAKNSSALDGSGSGTTYNTASDYPTFTDAPSIGPSVPGDLILAVGAMGFGPVSSCVPGQCVFDYVGSTTWTNGDGESYANGDEMAHQYAPTTGTVDFEWSAPSSTSGSLSAMAIAFKPASSKGVPPAPPTGLQATIQ
jgi:hypothetical protein